MHPWLVFLKQSGKRLSDIEYLAIKEFGGKRVDADNQQTLTTATETDTATQTASAGKDMYLGGATVMFSKSSSGSNILTMRLYINGVVVELIRKVAAVSGDIGFFNFLAKGNKVAATQIIKVTVDSNATDSIFWGAKLTLFEEDTGASPAV